MYDMTMLKSDFNYDLPEELIAQTPVEPRDSSRLMAIDRATGEITHDHFYNIDQYLRPGDLLFFWNSGRTRIYHTGIWLGGGKYIHASSSAGQVVVSGWSDWAKNSFSHGKRVY